jgi:hypothetical protein
MHFFVKGVELSAVYNCISPSFTFGEGDCDYNGNEDTLPIVRSETDLGSVFLEDGERFANAIHCVSGRVSGCTDLTDVRNSIILAFKLTAGGRTSFQNRVNIIPQPSMSEKLFISHRRIPLREGDVPRRHSLFGMTAIYKGRKSCYNVRTSCSFEYSNEYKKNESKVHVEEK